MKLLLISFLFIISCSTLNEVEAPNANTFEGQISAILLPDTTNINISNSIKINYISPTPCNVFSKLELTQNANKYFYQVYLFEFDSEELSCMQVIVPDSLETNLTFSEPGSYFVQFISSELDTVSQMVVVQ